MLARLEQVGVNPPGETYVGVVNQVRADGQVDPLRFGDEVRPVRFRGSNNLQLISGSDATYRKKEDQYKSDRIG